MLFWGTSDLRLGFGRRDFGPGSLVLWSRESVVRQDQAGNEVCARDVSLTWWGSHSLARTPLSPMFSPLILFLESLSFSQRHFWPSPPGAGLSAFSLLPAAGPSGPVVSFSGQGLSARQCARSLHTFATLPATYVMEPHRFTGQETKAW